MDDALYDDEETTQQEGDEDEQHDDDGALIPSPYIKILDGKSGQYFYRHVETGR